jgi:type II secretory pathway pseudopilin PulG
MLRLLLPRRLKGISLVETMVACGVFAILAASTVTALIRMNNNAILSRLQTGASTLAQNRIDLILSDGPFNPQKLNKETNQPQIPPVLVPGTQQIGTSINPTLAVYTDPATNQKVWGWMTSTVTDMGLSAGGQSLNIYRASVSVFYRYRGRVYNVTMNTTRASDI